nr:unnamed protein product [Callosobruchus analis]
MDVRVSGAGAAPACNPSNLAGFLPVGLCSFIIHSVSKTDYLMNRERLIAMWLLYRRRRRRLQKKRQRVYWVHPIVKKTLLVGAFYKLFQELLQYEQKLFNYFRMSIASFHELNHKLKGVLQRQDTAMRDYIEPKQMLAVAIRYLASGCTFTDLHYIYRLGLATIRNIVKEVCIAIWNVLRLECLPVQTKQKWEDIASCFEKKSKFSELLRRC